MSQQTHRIYRLEGIEIDCGNLTLRRDGRERHLRQKTFQVLIYLLEHRQGLVSRNELIESIWEDTSVTDNGLDQCLAEIRRALGDDSRNPRFLKTVPRAGYRFVGAVEEVDSDPVVEAAPAVPEPPAPASEITEPSPRHRPKPWRIRPVMLVLAAIILTGVTLSTVYFIRKRAAPPSLTGSTVPLDPAKQSVAVMFFENRSGSPDLDWLREGLADMIITDLSRSKNIAVLSREQLSVLLNRAGHRDGEKIELDEALAIAQHSQAKLVILGSFARLGEQIRIDVHLHDGRDGQLLTAESLIVDHPAQVLTQVDLLSLKLAKYLGATGTEGSPGLPSVMTDNLEAYRYYSLGVEMAQGLRNQEAAALLQKAIDLDPGFAMAYARIGYVHAVKESNLEKARPFLEKGYRLSDRLTEKDKLYIRAWYDIANTDYASAINSFQLIIASYPLEVEAYSDLVRLLRGEDRAAEALEIGKQGLVVDDASPELSNSIAFAYSDLGRHDEAIAMFQRYADLAPNEPNAHDSLGLGFQWAGRYAEAIAEYERALAIKPDFAIAVIHLGNTYFQTGRYQEALKRYQEIARSGETDLVRSRGWFAQMVVYWRLGKISLADQAAGRESQLRKSGPGNFLLALERGDRATAQRVLQLIESAPYSDRGARMYLRYTGFYRGYFELRLGNPQLAIEAFQEALRHRPMVFDIESYEDCLANAYLELGHLDEAIAEYSRILKLNPNYPLVHFHLAQAYERKGETDQARSEYRQFLETWKDADPDIPEVVSARKALGG